MEAMLQLLAVENVQLGISLSGGPVCCGIMDRQGLQMVVICSSSVWQLFAAAAPSSTLASA